MEQQLFDLFISGQLVKDVDRATAVDNFAKLFKTTSDKVERYFIGKPLIFKRGIDKAQALKYKEALHNAGVLVTFMAHRPTAEATSQSQNKEQQSTTHANTASTADKAAPQTVDTDSPLTIAAVGSDVLAPEERQQFIEANIDTSNIKLVSAFMDIEAEQVDQVTAPDTSHITVAAAGEDLIVDKAEPTAALPMNLDAITLAPPGADLEELHEELPALNPDISALSIAPAGAELLEGESKPAPPPPPDTSHISI